MNLKYDYSEIDDSAEKSRLAPNRPNEIEEQRLSDNNDSAVTLIVTPTIAEYPHCKSEIFVSGIG